MAEFKPLCLIRVLLALRLWGLLTALVAALLAASPSILVPKCASWCMGTTCMSMRGPDLQITRPRKEELLG